jgi:hypothetical protein
VQDLKEYRMKQRILIEAGGPNILNPGEGPDGAGFMPVCIPSYKRPQALFGIPVAKLRNELIEPMLRPSAHVYADVDFEPSEDDPDIVALFGVYSEDAPGPVSISNLELVRPS